MEINIPKNVENKIHENVSQSNTAKAYGSGLIDVYATPAMIALMEKTANLSVQEFLPEGCVSVGIEINAKHVKASRIGEDITCKSILEKQDGKKLYFKIIAFDTKDIIGEATHIRYVVNSMKFMEKLN